MSGWLLMGLPGAMYLSGLSSGWIVLGLTAGAYLNWLYVPPRLRTYTEVAANAITIPVFFENRFKDESKVLKITSAFVILIFFTFYTSSGIVAGGEPFETAFDVNYVWGIWLTASVVILYTLFGGFLAVSWTDFVQGTIMFIALILVPVVTIMSIGNMDIAMAEIESLDPNYLDNPETVFIVLSKVLFPPLVTGFLLAAILAAVMSTVASQLKCFNGRFLMTPKPDPEILADFDKAVDNLK